MVCINSIVNAKQKQTLLECDPILKCEYDFSISDVSVRELIHFIFNAGSIVYNKNLQDRIMGTRSGAHSCPNSYPYFITATKHGYNVLFLKS